MQIRFHAGATADITDAGDWYESQVPGLAVDFSSEVDRVLEVIGAQPMTWPLWPGVAPELGIRRFLLARFPFGVAYLVHQDAVVVLGVAHNRRRPGYWLDRVSGSTRSRP